MKKLPRKFRMWLLRLAVAKLGDSSLDVLRCYYQVWRPYWLEVTSAELTQFNADHPNGHTPETGGEPTEEHSPQGRFA